MRKEYDFSKGQRGKFWRFDSQAEKKRIERWFLNTAQSLSQLIPRGAIRDFEGPDFTIESETGTLGIELSELLPLGEGPIPPVAEERFHQEVIRIAEQAYGHNLCGKPVSVLAYFRNPRHERQDKWKLARELAEFVNANLPSASDCVTYGQRSLLPEGLDVVRLAFPPGPWISCESGTITAPEIYSQLAGRIREKNALLPSCRTALPNSRIWLLIYSSFSVPRGLPIPAGIEAWACQFDFDKVLFFAQLSNQVIEIRRAI